ncbi:MAG: flagellar brake protein [Deltaproteobacteria bacterium]|nr:flagellar brake protein [Deltaproteobacteria bacterium]
MPKLAIEPNSRLYVRFNLLNHNSQPMQGEFLGMSHYEFILLRLPSVPGLKDKLIPKTMLEIRFLLEGAVNTFSADIISYSVKPALILYATYPDRLSIMKTRQHHRLPCALPVSLTTASGDAMGIVCDLSQGGCRVCLELTGQSGLRNLAVDDDIVLQMPLSATAAPTGGTSVVRKVEITGSRLAVGLSFNEGQKDFLASVAGYLSLSHALEQ